MWCFGTTLETCKCDNPKLVSKCNSLLCSLSVETMNHDEH
jgi:hypothetical protein